MCNILFAADILGRIVYVDVHDDGTSLPFASIELLFVIVFHIRILSELNIVDAE